MATEDSSSRGRVDMAVRFNLQVYLFELKVVELMSSGSALEQLRDRDYAARYRADGEPVYLIGVEFSRGRAERRRVRGRRRLNDKRHRQSTALKRIVSSIRWSTTPAAST